MTTCAQYYLTKRIVNILLFFFSQIKLHIIHWHTNCVTTSLEKSFCKAPKISKVYKLNFKFQLDHEIKKINCMFDCSNFSKRYYFTFFDYDQHQVLFLIILILIVHLSETNKLLKIIY